jgi:hypothetical protein
VLHVLGWLSAAHNINVRGARAGYLKTHGTQEFLKIHDLRLTRGVVDDGFPLCPYCSHNDVFRGAYARIIEVYLRALHVPAVADDLPVFLGDVHTEHGETL